MNLQIGNESIREQNLNKNAGVAAYEKTQQASNHAAGAHSVAATDAFRLDLKGAGRTDTILDDGKKESVEMTAEMNAAGAQAKKDYMVLASNTMSPEAYGELAKDGYRPQETDPEDVVNTVDKIKARMAAAGKVIRGYNDDLSSEQLIQITGSEAYAAELTRAFSAQNVPLSETAAEEAAELRDTMQKITELTDGAKNYLVEHALQPTAENLYLAAHSASGVPAGKAAGYVQTGQYLGRTAATQDTAALREQTEKLILRAGDEVTDERLATAERMLSQGVSLTEENYLAMRKLDELQLPMSDAKIADVAARALSDAVPALKEDLTEDRTLLEQAVAAKEAIDSVSDEDVDRIAESELPLTIKNLSAKAAQIPAESPKTESSEARVITARRQVAEVRLTMTVEVNLRLLKRGVALDTTELSRLVEDLKSMEKEIMQRTFEAKDDAEAALRSSIFDETTRAVSEIPGMPVSVVGDLLVRRSSITTVTLTQYTESAKSAQLAFAAAGERYETMMTVPRADLGDSLRSAFDRADSLMKELGIEQTEENARAVRILGYNEMELSAENIDAVKEAYRTVNDITERMTPAVTLQMIREGVNPMRLTMDELDRRLSRVTDGIAPTGEKYSEYLVRLEQKNAITSEEKESYIGIYRMLHQIGKHDTAAVGTLLKQGTELSFSNLMTAVRSRRDRGMDISVNDDLDGVTSTVTNGIDEQIEAAYAAGSYFSAEEELKEASGVPIEVYEELQQMQLPASADHVLGLNENRKDRGSLHRGVKDAARHLSERVSGVSGAIHGAATEETAADTERLSAEGASDAEKALEAAIADTLESFTSPESAQEAYSRMTELMEQTVGEAMETSTDTIDVRRYSLMMKQIGVAGALSREESYDIPMLLEGEETTVNVRIVHEGRQTADAEIRMETSQYGHVRARFSALASGALQGYAVCGSEEGTERLSGLEGILRERFSENGLELGELYFATSERAALNISAVLSDERNSSVDTTVLYRAAKIFLTTIGA